jgi:hypothetical protein
MLVTSECSYEDRVIAWVLPGTGLWELQEVTTVAMRSITRQKCVDCRGLFAALVTSDCSYRDRVGLMLAVHFPPRRISGIPDYV